MYIIVKPNTVFQSEVSTTLLLLMLAILAVGCSCCFVAAPSWFCECAGFRFQVKTLLPSCVPCYIIATASWHSVGAQFSTGQRWYWWLVTVIVSRATWDAFKCYPYFCNIPLIACFYMPLKLSAVAIFGQTFLGFCQAESKAILMLVYKCDVKYVCSSQSLSSTT